MENWGWCPAINSENILDYIRKNKNVLNVFQLVMNPTCSLVTIHFSHSPLSPLPYFPPLL